MEINGQKVPDFLDITISQRMHGLHDFQVTCRMDTFEEPDDFVINKSKKFIGSTMVIEIFGDNKSSSGLFFKGVIHAVRAVKSDLSNEDKIVLLGCSPEFLLSDHRGCRSYENKTIEQIVNEVLKPFPRDTPTRYPIVYSTVKQALNSSSGLQPATGSGCITTARNLFSANHPPILRILYSARTLTPSISH
jgi:hypothetical protein